MSELPGKTNIIRPQVGAGDFDWNKAPEKLFVKASLLASLAKDSPVNREALNDFRGLKRLDLRIRLIKSRLQSQEELIEKGQTDAFFNIRARKNLRRQLSRANKKLATDSQNFAEKSRTRTDFGNAADDIMIRFSEMERLLNPQWNDLEPKSQAIFATDLFKLIGFYLSN